MARRVPFPTAFFNLAVDSATRDLGSVVDGGRLCPMMFLQVLVVYKVYNHLRSPSPTPFHCGSWFTFGCVLQLKFSGIQRPRYGIQWHFSGIQLFSWWAAKAFRPRVRTLKLPPRNRPWNRGSKQRIKTRRNGDCSSEP